MVSDAALELSLDQPIVALDKKLFMECTRMQMAMPPVSRVLVTTLAAEIDALEKRARDILNEVVTLRNSLRPVNRLPPKVLASCTTFVSNTDPRPIVSLTHVCRYWRRSISSNPRSWASIATGWKRLTPLCLERAGAVPLSVDMTVSDLANNVDFLEPLLPHTSKIGCLRLTKHRLIEGVTDDLPGFFDSPMPNLTSLELQQVAEPSANLFPPSGTPVPPVFKNVSKLKTLRLTRTPVYPTLFSIASLRELRLLGYENPLNFGTFIGFLRLNRDLEHVVLDVRFVANSVETEFNRNVSPPRLQNLSITCYKTIDSKGLLSCISFPHGTHIEVTSIGLDRATSLGSFMPSPPTPIHDLLVPITTIKTQLTPAKLQLIGNGSSFTLHGVIALWEFPTAAVRELYVDPFPLMYSAAILHSTMKVLPALEILAFSRTPFPAGLLSGLIEEPVLCPALKTIAFLDCDIDSDIIKQLEEAMAKRGDSTAARMYRVVIVNSAGTILDRTSIQQLRKSVPCVDIRVDDKFPDLS